MLELTRCQPRLGQHLQVEAHRAGVKAGHLGQLPGVQRLGGLTQTGEERHARPTGEGAMSRYFASIARIHATIIREYTHLNFEKVRHDPEVRSEVVGGGRLAAGIPAGAGRPGTLAAALSETAAG
jgi:hypothetical protein